MKAYHWNKFLAHNRMLLLDAYQLIFKNYFRSANPGRYTGVWIFKMAWVSLLQTIISREAGHWDLMAFRHSSTMADSSWAVYVSGLLPLTIYFSISAGKKGEKEQLTSYWLQKSLSLTSLQLARVAFLVFPFVCQYSVTWGMPLSIQKETRKRGVRLFLFSDNYDGLNASSLQGSFLLTNT